MRRRCGRLPACIARWRVEAAHRAGGRRRHADRRQAGARWISRAADQVASACAALASWTDPDLRFWHYRDKDQVEVDIVITRGRKVWGIEVKASSLVGGRDGRGLARLADACGRDFQGGVIMHNGTDTLPTGDPRVLAVPLRALWR